MALLGDMAVWGVHMAVLEEVSHCEGRVRGLTYTQATSSILVHFLLPARRSFSVPSLAPCLSAYRSVLHDDNGQNL